ncbi:molybdopterin-dependent oxidoreductase [Hoeflea sp. TYP-13]|uniref:nitrate reductase n=1 Tax=Hoeflea sp. TYP-13 TaxID=3230023 RepID=UPI0034C6200A
MTAETEPNLSTTRTTCPYCGVGCGLLAKRDDDGGTQISGDPEHPANFGRLCSKGSALGETIGLEGRLLYPEIDDQRVDWDEALDLVAERFSEAIAEHGPDSVAFYVSGQLLTEDYYVANKLMKGFIGSANIDTNSRLCMASSVAGHRRAFGSDTVPGTYEDLELADLVVLVGSNLAWCHPVLYQRLQAAKAERPEMRVVLIDPRATMTEHIADMHLAIAPDGDAALFGGLLAYLAETQNLDLAYIERHTEGFDGAMASAQSISLETIADQTGLSETEIEAFYRLFAETDKTVTVYSQGVNQSSIGTDKVNAIINCHLATGRIGRPGAGPFSVTGQPNAMGGREVGGLANMLAAHMDIENAVDRDIVGRFWRARNLAAKPGLKAVELFQAVGEGRIKALWIMATNPADSMPDADAVEAALQSCPFVVVSDVVSDTDTMRHANVKLPALAWGEKDGTVTNSERRISRQRAFLPSPGKARADWWQVAQVATRMGFAEEFAYDSPAAIYREYAALTGFENAGTRDLDVGAHGDISDAAYAQMRPFQWPLAADNAKPEKRFFADGGYYTPNGKAQFVAVAFERPKRADNEYPLTLNTGRLRDQWHTMTRTGKSPRLAGHTSEPHCEIHPKDAADIGVNDGDLARIQNEHGEMVARVHISERQRIGSVFASMHWTDQFAAKGRVNALVPSVIDLVSGQPALKHATVCVTPMHAALFGFAVCAAPPVDTGLDYWAMARADGGWRVEFARAEPMADIAEYARMMIASTAEMEMLTYFDEAGGTARIAFFDGRRLEGAFFFSLRPVDVARVHMTEELMTSFDDPRARFRVVAGRPSADRPDPGPVVCSCLSVGANEIAMAAASGCGDVDAIGTALGAGTSCGSCRAEIQGIINAQPPVAARQS